MAGLPASDACLQGKQGFRPGRRLSLACLPFSTAWLPIHRFTRHPSASAGERNHHHDSNSNANPARAPAAVR